MESAAADIRDAIRGLLELVESGQKSPRQIIDAMDGASAPDGGPNP